MGTTVRVLPPSSVLEDGTGVGVCPAPRQIKSNEATLVEVFDDHLRGVKKPLYLGKQTLHGGAKVCVKAPNYIFQ